MTKGSIYPPYAVGSSNTNPNSVFTASINSPVLTNIILSEPTGVSVSTRDGTIEHVTYSELVKYTEERKLIQENELVRALWERFQMAAKLAKE